MSEIICTDYLDCSFCGEHVPTDPVLLARHLLACLRAPEAAQLAAQEAIDQHEAIIAGEAHSIERMTELALEVAQTGDPLCPGTVASLARQVTGH